MSGGSGIAEINCLGTSLPGFCDQILILARVIFRPVGAAQVGLCPSIVGIDLERLAEQNDGAVHIGGFAGILEIATRLSVIIVSIGHAGAVEGQFATLVGLQRKSEPRGHGLGEVILDSEGVGDGRIGRSRFDHFPSLGVGQRVGDSHQIT